MMHNYSGKVVKSYEIKERIGAGGFGAVYRAIQPAVGREVAIKIILPQHANQAEFIQRFETEAQLVARLEHPYIVPLYDYWRDPSGAYLVMRLLRGGSLRDSIEEHGPWGMERVAQMLNQIATALTFAHRSNVIHRDMKSDNILIDFEGNSYLTDFGIAKDLGGGSELTRDNILGTPAYLSPEQIRGEIASAQSDIYALGIMIFETLTGSKPFIDHTPATVLFKQLNEPLPNVHLIRDELPEELNVVLQKATSKDASLRYETPLDFARDFTAIVRETLPALPSSGTMTMDVLSITSAEKVLFQPKNPYKGLRAFQQADASDFFGREQLVNHLLHRVSREGDNWDFLAVVGPSGSGKSSVVKAGMLPHIQGGILDPSLNWFITEMVPGTYPMEELEAALLAISSHEVPGLLEQLREDERGLVRAVRRILPDDKSEFVLFIDQFEEVFTLVEDEDRRTHFLNSLMNAASDVRSRIKIVITMRADFYDRPLLYAKFGELMRKNTELVLPLNDEELENTIIAPADRVGLQLEAGLIAAIISDVKQQPGALPLLQYALTELFERRDGRKMTLSAYRDIGGTTGALARRAEEVYQSFNEEQKAAARQMFLRLVALGDGTDDTRRRVLQSELLSLGKTAMRKVIDEFGKYRLLTFDHDLQTRGSTIEVAHEAIIRQWQQVRTWLEENRAALQIQRRLTVSSEEWERARRDASFLASGSRLQQFEELAKNQDIALNQSELHYIEMSVQAREARARQEAEQAAREESLKQQARQRLQLLAAVMTVAAIISIGLAVFAINAQGRAQMEAERASTSEAQAIQNADRAATSESRALVSAEIAATSAAEALQSESESRALALAANARNAIAADNPMLGLALALEAKNVYQPLAAEVLRTLSTASYAPNARYHYTGYGGAVLGAAFSPDGRYGFSASTDATVRVWDNQTGEKILEVTLPPYQVEGVEKVNVAYAIALHPDMSQFAVGSDSGTIYLYEFPSGELLRTLTGHTGVVRSLDYHPNGAFLLSGGYDHSLRLWGITSGTVIRTYEGHTGAVLQAIFSPDGSRIASSSADETIADNSRDVVDRTIRLWDAETGAQLALITPSSGFVRAIDYSPDGLTVAGGFWDSANGGTVRIYDATTGAEIKRFFGHTTPIGAIRYSSDGKTIVSVGWDRVVHLWDVAKGIQIQSFAGFPDNILTMDYSTDSQYLLLGLGNAGGNEVREQSAVPSMYLWDVKSRDQVGAYTAHQDWAWTVDISPDGQLAASAGGPLRLPQAVAGQAAPDVETTVYIWNIATGETVSSYRQHTNTVDSVRFHPTQPWVLSGAWDNNIVLWNYETNERVQLYREHEAAVYMLRFVGDGSRFLSASQDGSVRLWDTESGRVLRLYNAGVRVNGIDLSPDGTMLAAGVGDFGRNENAVILWDFETGAEIRRMAGHTALLSEVHFHPSGASIVSTSWDGTVRLWDVATGVELRRFTGHNGSTFGIDFSHDGSIMLTTSQDKTVRMWDFASGEELHRFNQHTDWVQEVVFTPDNRLALSAGQDRAVRIWRINLTGEQLDEFAHANRLIRELTCAERAVYRLPACES